MLRTCPTLRDFNLEKDDEEQEEIRHSVAKNRTPENLKLKRKYRNIATRERRKAIM